MPKYYFDIAGKDQNFPDQEGIEMRDLAAAHDFAVQLIARMLRSDPEECDWSGWRVEIADAQAQVALTVLFPVLPRPRAHFGKRLGAGIPLATLLTAVIGFGATVTNQTAAATDIACLQTPSALLCRSTSGQGANARIVFVDPVRTPEENERSIAREREWLARCSPMLHQDRYGVGRYFYALPGCEHGRTTDVPQSHLRR